MIFGLRGPICILLHAFWVQKLTFNFWSRKGFHFIKYFTTKRLGLIQLEVLVSHQNGPHFGTQGGWLHTHAVRPGSFISEKIHA